MWAIIQRIELSIPGAVLLCLLTIPVVLHPAWPIVLFPIVVYAVVVIGVIDRYRRRHETRPHRGAI